MKPRSLIIFLFLVLVGGLAIWITLKDHSPEKKESPKTSSYSADEHSENHKEEDHDHSDQKDNHQDKDHDHEEKEGEGHGHGEPDEEESVGGVGKNNAVTAADEHDGIRLSEKAVEAMGIKTSPYEGGPIPDSAFVFYQDRVGVYRLREGWFKLVPLPASNQEGSGVPASGDLKAGDQLVVQGKGLLRAAELDAFSGEVGHSH